VKIIGAVRIVFSMRFEIRVKKKIRSKNIAMGPIIVSPGKIMPESTKMPWGNHKAYTFT
jgi:hypothetical protein